MATCARDSARRATPAGTPSRSTQAGARHRERAEPVVFFPSSPLISVTAVLSSSPSSPMSPSSAITAASAPFPSHRLRLCFHRLRPSPSSSSVSITVTSLHSGFHRPQHRSPSSSAAVAVLFSPHLLASVATPPVSSSSRHRPSHLLLLSTSDYYLDHRRRLPSLFLSSAPPSASRPPSLSHRPLPLLSLFALSLSPSFTPVTPLPLPLHLLRFGLCPSAPVTKTEHHRRPCSLFTPPPAFRPHLPCVSLPPSSQPSIVVAHRHHHPPLHCVAECHRRSLVSPPQPPSPSSPAPLSANCRSLPCFSVSEYRRPPPSTPSLFLFPVHPPSTSPIVVVSALSWTSSVTTSCRCQRRRRRHFPLPAPR